MKFIVPAITAKMEPVVTLPSGRIAHVVKRHHASPRERWQMWKFMREVEAEYIAEKGRKSISLRKYFAMNFMFLATVLSPSCEACYYEVVDG